MTFSPFNPNVPIPNNPFYSPESAYLYGPSGPLIVGSGFSINNITGVIDVSGGGSGAPTILPGVGISVVSGVGTVTIANTGILTLTAGSGISVSGSGSNLTITNTAPAPSVIGTVSSVSTGTGLVGGPITSTGTISLAPVGTVAPGTYTNATITVDIYGRVTFAAPGSGLGSLLQATAPLSVNASIPQTISISNASTAASGAVQLNSSTNSTSTTQAATPSAVKTTFDLATTAAANSATALSASTSAVTTAGNAQITANNALSTANAAQTVANTAQTTANSALVNASAAQVTANAAIPCSSFTVKGQVLAATGPSTFVALNSGVNGQVLVACSTCASGLTWLSQPSVPGTVTSVATGIGLTGGTITTTGTIALSTSGVSAGTYTNATVAVDTFGRVTAASTGAPPIPNACIIGKGALVTGLGVSTPVALPVGADNRLLTACSACPSGLTWAPGGSGSVTSVATGTGLTGGTITSTGTITLANTAVIPGAYTSANITIDAQGRITDAANGSGGSVTSVTGTAPIVSSGGATPAISLADTAVSAGAYTYGSFTVDDQGRLTAASSGVAPLTALTGTSPIAVTSGTAPIVSIAASSTTTPGAVQLADAAAAQAGVSTALAVTPAAGAVAYVLVSSIGAKGELFVGLANDSVGVLTVGADNTTLVACAACTQGITWRTGSPLATPTVSGAMFGIPWNATLNTSVGCQALLSVSSGQGNTALGYGSGALISAGNENVAVGTAALSSETIGNRNTAIGAGALCAQVGASNNTAVGFAVGSSLTTGFNNSMFGSQSGNNLTTGCFNVLIGQGSGLAMTSGIENTFLGDASGASSNGANNVFIGTLAGATNTTGSGVVIIGSNGTSSSTTVSNEANIYAGTTVARFDQGSVAWTFTSDARKKENVADLALGLDFISKVQPRTFDWKEDGQHAAGFIAQELDAVVEEFDAGYLGVVSKADPECYTVAQAALIPVLVNAIKELAAEVAELKAKLG